jgi:hypothetical protein
MVVLYAATLSRKEHPQPAIGPFDRARCTGEGQRFTDS